MKAIFRRSKHNGNDKAKEDPTTVNLDPNPDILNLSTPSRDLRPTQFQPNRIATLYVTPSDRDLYLKAMSQLDRPPAPLPLWSEPAPKLPQLTVASTSTSASTNPMNKNDPNQLNPGMDNIYWPRSPKLVTSPQLAFGDGSGLHVRDEVRRLSPLRTIRHALIALTLPAGLRFTAFPLDVLLNIHEKISKSWSEGIASVSEPIENLRQLGNDSVIGNWKIELRGQAWKRKGNEELDSIRLILDILTLLGKHGWILVGSVQAALTKKDPHDLLFAHTPGTDSPLFFAVTFPLHDRIALINPPPKSTPALISALRNAITNPGAGYTSHSRSATTQTAVSSSTIDPSMNPSKRVTWAGEPLSKGIRNEGWVHKGVYAFHLNGLRRWLGGGVKAKAFENLSPHLLLAIVNSLSDLHYSLVASIPLLPVTKGRDILYFASLSGSGLDVNDSFALEENPVVPPTNLAQEIGLNRKVSLARGASETGNENTARKKQARSVDPEKRVLPWTSVADDPATPRLDPAVQPVVATSAPPSRQPSLDQPKRQSSLRARTPSGGKSGSVPSSPRPKGLLLKKNSMRRRSMSSSGGGLRAAAATGVSATSATARNEKRETDKEIGETRGDGGPSDQSDSIRNAIPQSDRWSLVEPPHHVGPLELSGVSAWNPIHADKRDTLGTSDTDQSEYQDATDGARQPWSSVADPSEGTLSHHDPPRALVAINATPSPGPALVAGPVHQQPSPDSQADDHLIQTLNNSALAALGTPVDVDPTLPIRTGKSPRRRELIDVGSGIGVQSVHGSLGFLPSTFSGKIGHDRPRSQIGHRRDGSQSHSHSGVNPDITSDISVPVSTSGQDSGPIGGDEMTKTEFGPNLNPGGNGKRVWDEDQGVWVQLHHDANQGFGFMANAAETKVSKSVEPTSPGTTQTEPPITPPIMAQTVQIPTPDAALAARASALALTSASTPAFALNSNTATSIESDKEVGSKKKRRTGAEGSGRTRFKLFQKG